MFEFVKRVAKKVAGLTVMSSVSFVSACAYGPDPVRCVEGEGICFDEKTLQRCMEDGYIYDIDCTADNKHCVQIDESSAECVSGNAADKSSD